MRKVFGFDIGTTSIGFAVISYDVERETGVIHRMGVRIFPEARDPDGTPLNQARRQKRMARRQLRRRRERRRALNEHLAEGGLLPAFKSKDWDKVMEMQPAGLRAAGLSEPLEAYCLGRAIYHLSKRRHFKGRDLEEAEDVDTPDEKEAKTNRDTTLKILRTKKQTLGQFLAEKAPHERQRGVHADRQTVEAEFEKLIAAQRAYHTALADPDWTGRLHDLLFAQRPVFWRLNTLGECRFVPGSPLCPKGSWLSQQRRMLEKLNNLTLAGGNARPLDAEERAAILGRLQTQASMSWSGVRSALKDLYKTRGEPGAERVLKFNLELGGDSKLLGNAVEAKLADIFGDRWASNPQKQMIRNTVPGALWSADYGVIGTQRVVIRPEAERRARRQAEAERFKRAFGVSDSQAAALIALSLPGGWEPYSIEALEKFLPLLERGERFGALVSGPNREDWRNTCFPNRRQPTGEIMDRLPSPADPEEQARIAQLRNPTVVRVQNELRKVVNNLIRAHGKPDLIRVELAREVGKSKRERENMKARNGQNERQRTAAAKDLRSNGIEPSRADIEKWALWQECQKTCPYTGDKICFDALFRTADFEVEHIWPRSRSLDDSFANKTLCRRDVNLAKGNLTPSEHFAHREDEWAGIVHRLNGMMAGKNGAGFSPGKVKRFLAKAIPEDFATRQLNDTGFAARQAIAFLKRLWPDVGIEAPVTVQAVTGRVTAQLRRLWTLNNILSDDGEKTRADHRHHAIDALVVACTHPGMTQRLSNYWQKKDEPAAPRPQLPPPWPTIRIDAERAVAEIVVSHRVRKKVSGPLHKETIYGDTEEQTSSGGKTYREFVARKKVEALTKGELERIRDPAIREIVKSWIDAHGGDPKKAFATYPKVSDKGPEIRKVRLTFRQQLSLMAQVSTGYADLGANHHIAIYRTPAGAIEFEIVSLFEASRRLARREPVVRKSRNDGSSFVMSLAPGDAVELEEGAHRGLRIVQGVWAAGPIVTVDHRDAVGSSVWRPTAGSIIASKGRKVSIDPIGRIRPARD